MDLTIAAVVSWYYCTLKQYMEMHGSGLRSTISAE